MNIQSPVRHNMHDIFQTNFTFWSDAIVLNSPQLLTGNYTSHSEYNDFSFTYGVNNYNAQLASPC